MSEYFPEQKYLERRVEVELDVCNYATKSKFEKCSMCF